MLGLPVVLFADALPEWAQGAAETLVGAVIVVLAVRLLLRWRRGYFHAHPHSHGPDVVHAHAHEHEHRHEETIGRSAGGAVGIGVLHGAGGSAGVRHPADRGDRRPRGGRAGAAAVRGGDGAVDGGVLGRLGRLLVSRTVERRLSLLTPALGGASLMFGCWYGSAGSVEVADQRGGTMSDYKEHARGGLDPAPTTPDTEKSEPEGGTGSADKRSDESQGEQTGRPATRPTIPARPAATSPADVRDRQVPRTG